VHWLRGTRALVLRSTVPVAAVNGSLTADRFKRQLGRKPQKEEWQENQ